MLRLLLGVFGFWGRLGRAARESFTPWGIGGLGLMGPPGELEEEAALGRGAGSGLVSTRGGVFSGEPVGESDLLTEPVRILLCGSHSTYGITAYGHFSKQTANTSSHFLEGWCKLTCRIALGSVRAG